MCLCDIYCVRLNIVFVYKANLSLASAAGGSRAPDDLMTDDRSFW